MRLGGYFVLLFCVRAEGSRGRTAVYCYTLSAAEFELVNDVVAKKARRRGADDAERQ